MIAQSHFITEAGRRVQRMLLRRYEFTNAHGYCCRDPFGGFIYLFKFLPPDLERVTRFPTELGAIFEICAPKPKRWNAARVTFELGNLHTGLILASHETEIREPEFSAKPLVDEFETFTKRRICWKAEQS